MPPCKRKGMSVPDPPRKQTRSETAKNPPKPESGEPAAKKRRVQPRMRPVPVPSPSPPVIDIEDDDVAETSGPSSQSNQRRLVHSSPDTKPDSDLDVDELISNLLSSDAEPKVNKPESSPDPKRVPRKITLRLSSKQVHLSRETTQKNNPLANDDEIAVAYESPDHLAFAIHKNGIKQRTIAIPLDISYATFCLHVADEYQVAAHGMDLNYKTNRMAKSDSWCGLASSKDFESILQRAQITIASDAERYRLAVIKNVADAKLARKQGRDHVPKPVATVRQFVILIRDQNFDKNAKALGSKKEKKSKSESEEGKAAPWKDLAKQIIEYEKQLTARKCNACNKNCILVPVPGQPPIHKELTKAEINLWAQLAAKSPDITLTSPLPQLQLQHSDSHLSRRTKAKAPTTNNPTPGAGPSNHGGNAQVPLLYPSPAILPPNAYHPYYQPGPPVPPPMPYGYFGGYAGPYAGYPPVYPGAFGHPPVMGGGGNMPLSEWLLRCDCGQRGENHENFSGLVAGFTAKNLYSLSDLRGKSEEYFLSIDFPTIQGGPTFRIHPDTATRLVQYVNADLPHF